MWIWMVIGAVIGLILYIGSLDSSPAKRETTLTELDDWDGQSQLEELEEEE